MYDLIIIGGGPAGISAGIYSARQNIKTLLVAKGFGGQMARKAVNINNYLGFEEISGMDLMKKFEDQLRKQPIDIEIGAVRKVEKSEDVFKVLVEEKEFLSKAVIIASGADPRPLEIPGEKEFIGKGVSYCTICDGPLFANKTVAVVGGGNSGFEVAIALSVFVKNIYLLESSSEIKADESNQEKAKKTNKIEVITSAMPQEIKGDKFVKSLVYKNKESEKIEELAVEGIFVEIGSQPATSFVKDLVDFSQRDEIMIDPKNNQTKTPGLFAAGDVSNVSFKQIIIAAGEGAKAALSAQKYIQ